MVSWLISIVTHEIICFFFKQKTAYEMRISDWSSDVCSSDLALLDDSFHFHGRTLTRPAPLWNPVGVERAWLEALHGFAWLRDLRAAGGDAARHLGRASCRERVCPFV